MDVSLNERDTAVDLKSRYDFIVCGSGSSGSVVARRLAENPEVSVLLLEAGGSGNVPSVIEGNQWPLNLGSERDWAFAGEPNPHLNGRAIPLSMGKVLGGGSSINAMAWARGHKNDWDFFAAEARDPAWSYRSVLDIYRRIEDWHGDQNEEYRGSGGPVFVQPAEDPSPIAPAMLDGARSVGIPTFESNNGRMMEGGGGASILDLILRDGKRQSIFHSYVRPYLSRANLTVLTHATVTRITLSGNTASGVELILDGKTRRIEAEHEVILSLGAINTPRVLMSSGIGDERDLQHLGISVVQHLPGVGQNFQDHFGMACVWEYQRPLPPRNNASEATYFWKSDSTLDTPDLQTCHIEVPVVSSENSAKFNPPDAAWTMLAGVVRPKSRGRLRLTGPTSADPIQIEANTLSHPDDMKAAIMAVDLAREIAESAPLRPFNKREIMPGELKGAELENFIRNAAVTYWHQSCTAKMGHDAMSVVDGNLKVYGIDKLRIADASIMPRVTTGNTMAPCVVIGERAGEVIRASHHI